MLRGPIERGLVALLTCGIAVVAAPAQPAPASAKQGNIRSDDSIHVEVRGKFSAAAGAAAERTSFQITASGITWEVDASANQASLQMAETLDGRMVIANGTYEQRKGDTRVRSLLTADALKLAPEAGRNDYIAVTIRGTLKTGVMAIGAETTGVTITSRGVTWELELARKQREATDKLNGRKVIISGLLRQQRGVELRNRLVVKVRTIRSTNESAE